MPFTEEGVVSRFGNKSTRNSSRMSVGQVIEMLAGKAGTMEGKRMDGTPFGGQQEAEIMELLKENGFRNSWS